MHPVLFDSNRVPAEASRPAEDQLAVFLPALVPACFFFHPSPNSRHDPINRSIAGGGGVLCDVAAGISTGTAQTIRGAPHCHPRRAQVDTRAGLTAWCMAQAAKILGYYRTVKLPDRPRGGCFSPCVEWCTRVPVNT